MDQNTLNAIKLRSLEPIPERMTGQYISQLRCDIKRLIKAYEEAEQDDRLVKLPIAKEQIVYVVTDCKAIRMYSNYDYESGPSDDICPFENQCTFDSCEDNQKQIIKTYVDSFVLDCSIECDEIRFWLGNINGEYGVDDIGKTVFLTCEEAEAALNKEAQP